MRFTGHDIGEPRGRRMTPGAAPALDRAGQTPGGGGHRRDPRRALGRFDLSRLDLSRFDLSRLDLSCIELPTLDLSRFGLTRLGLGSLRASLSGLSLRSLASRSARVAGSPRARSEIVSGAHVAAVTTLVMGVLLGLVGGFLLARPSAPVRRPPPRPPAAEVVLLDDPAGRADPPPPVVDGTPILELAPAPAPAPPPGPRVVASEARPSAAPKRPSMEAATASVAPRIASARAVILLDSRRH